MNNDKKRRCCGVAVALAATALVLAVPATAPAELRGDPHSPEAEAASAGGRCGAKYTRIDPARLSTHPNRLVLRTKKGKRLLAKVAVYQHVAPDVVGEDRFCVAIETTKLARRLSRMDDGLGFGLAYRIDSYDAAGRNNGGQQSALPVGRKGWTIGFGPQPTVLAPDASYRVKLTASVRKRSYPQLRFRVRA